VKLDASAIANAITEIGTVQIAGGKNVSFASLRDGTLSSVSDATQNVTFSGTSNVQTSGYYPFYPSPTKVTISSITMTLKNSTAKTISTPLTANFTKTLAAATSYTLVLDVREGRWAHSNIYWTGSALTFDQTDLGHEDYQGVFFKWGSLVGIAPGPIAEYTLPTTATLYIRNPSTGTWNGTYQINSGSGKGWSGTTYNNIPYINYSSDLNAGSFDYKLYDYPGVTNYTGDICQRIDSEWRMPNKSEFGVAANYGTRNTATYDPGDATGKGSMNQFGVTYNSAYGVVFFPAAGAWENMDGSPYSYIPGKEGRYWLGEKGTSSASGAMFLFLGSGLYLPTSSAGTKSTVDAFPIRCIKKLSTD
jgi:hypothetical protein